MENYREELKKTRRALLNILEDVEETRNKIKAIISNLADGLIVLDAGGRVDLINWRAAELLGLKQGELEGKTLESSKKEPIKQLAQLISKKRNLSKEEFPLKKSKERFLEVTTISLEPRKEKVIILHDITREKLIDQMKSGFVSYAAHQLKTPLTSIKWAMETLLEEDFGKITREQKEVLSEAREINEKMLILVEDLLNLARIEEGRYLYKPTFTQIEKIVQSIIESYKERATVKKIKVNFKKPKERLPEVKIDVEKIRIAIDNFINNAIQYTPKEGEVTVSLKRGKKEIEFQVRDTGIGIPKNQQKRIFNKFFRATNATKIDDKGTGLGLFITKNIIEAHGGKIWFESKEGKGTTFYFTLPLKK